MSAARTIFPLGLAFFLVAGTARAQTDDGTRSADEATLREAGLSADGPKLLDFFRKRAAPDADPERLKELLARLGDKSEETRKKAVSELVSLGAAAVPALRQAANTLDEEGAAELARKCLGLVDGSASAALVAAAARSLAAARPEGAAGALLAYLPMADDEGTARSVEEALAAVALRDGTPDPAVREALKDPLPARRAAAAEVLCRAGGAARAEARALLQDPKPSVRFRVAMALAAALDAEAVPVLIDLLAVLPQAPRKTAEEFLTQLAGEWAVTAPPGNDAVSGRLRRDLWAAWWAAVDGKALLTELRRRTLSDDDREKVLALIGRLNAPSAATRDQAVSDLLARGTAAVPLLRQATNDPNNRAAPYAARCLQLIETDGPTPFPAAALRLLGLRRPDGVAEALLAYLPFAETESLAEQAQASLAAVAVRDGKPEPLLVRALEDRAAARRAAAAELLSRAGAIEHLPEVVKLLDDPEPAVRLRVALAVAAARDKRAVPVMIALLGELSQDQAWQVEDYLVRLAAERAPQPPSGNEPGGRKKYLDAWAAWWKQHGDGVTLPKADDVPQALGLTLIVAYDGFKGRGQVWEVGRDGKERWKLDDLANPIDAQMLPGNRVLVAEHGGMKVSERDLKGQVLWEHRTPNNPVCCQRLPNGNTFIATYNNLMEVTRDGKVVYNHSQTQDTIYCAQKLRNGNIVFVGSRGTLTEIDEKGKQLKSFNVGTQNSGWTTVEPLPGGHYLVPSQASNKVAEFDGEGKKLREVNASQPNAAVRLPNGNYLVSSNNTSMVQEVDRNGKVVWEQRLQGRPFRVKRR